MRKRYTSLKWYQSIRTRFFAAFSLLVIFFSVFIYLYFPNRLRSTALDGISEQASSFAEFVAFSLSPTLVFDDPMAADETMVAAKENDQIAYLLIEDREGKLFSSFGDSLARVAGYKESETSRISMDKSIWMTTAPITHVNSEIGKVYVGHSLKEVNETIQRSRRFIALISLLCLVLGIAFVFWVTGVLTRKLSRIVTTADRIGSGDIQQRAEIRSNDEVGILASSFNAMLERLEQSTGDLKKRERQFRRLAENMSEGLIQLDTDMVIRYVNPRCISMFGYAEETLLGQPLSIIAGDDQLPDFGDEALEDQVEISLLNREGKPLWVLLSYAIANDGHVTAIFTEITKLKQTERDLLYKNRELDTFVYKASHDLKAPLSSLRGLVDIAQGEVEGNAADQYFGLILRTIDKMDDVLLGLLEVTWIKQGAMEYGKIDLGELFDIILRSIKHAPGFETVDVRFDVPEGMGIVSDLKMINSVLQNLIHNAIKYHRDEGDDKFVQVTVRDMGTSTNISILDNGPGVAEHHQEKLFDMFFRASLKSNGSGLGLYIVKNSIEKLEGTISLKSEVGKGTEFIVVLPHVELPEPEVPKDEQQTGQS